jgi:hypothetical protein
MIRISVGRSLAAMGLSSLLAAGVPMAQAATVSGQGTWETTLQGRDLDGNLNNGFEAFYDTTQNLTWLADANLAATKGVSASGLVLGFSPFLGAVGAPDTAVGIAYAANVYGIDGWQLPSVALGNEIYKEVCEPGRTTCDVIPTGRYSVIPGSSQLQQLMEVALGNRSSINGGYTLENTGPFKNLQTGLYWSSKFMATTGSYSGWAYDTATGQHVQQPYFANGYAWLVRAGDVAAVPEPQTAALWALGLLALMGVVSRQKVAAPQ